MFTNLKRMKRILSLMLLGFLVFSILSCKDDKKEDPQPAPIDYKKLLAGDDSKTWYWHAAPSFSDPQPNKAVFTMRKNGTVFYPTAGKEYRWDYNATFKDSVSGNNTLQDFNNYLRHIDTTVNPNFIFIRGEIQSISETEMVFFDALDSRENPLRWLFKTTPQ